MKIAIHVSEIASLIGMNCFRSQDTILRFIRNKIYTNYSLDKLRHISPAQCDNVINKYISDNRSHFQDSINIEGKYVCEFDNFYIFCEKNEISILYDGLLFEQKSRISEKVKYFLPLIDLVQIQFYLLLTQCRRCLLKESWNNGYTRNTYIKFDKSKLDVYIQLLTDAVTYLSS